MKRMERINMVLMLLSLSLTVTINALSVPRHPQHVRQVTIQVNGYKPVIDDDYIAVSMSIEPGYIVRFQPFADADRVHHILLYGCSYPAWPKPFGKDLAHAEASSHIFYMHGQGM
ncbi:hypothetical protein WUBG_11896, partial [Wuchereria bancrofti]